MFFRTSRCVVFSLIHVVVTCKLTKALSDCGQPVIKPLMDNNFKIFGGTEARPHSWPWQVFIKVCPSSQCDLCGGSLVSQDKIITAAHCTNFGTYPPSKFEVRLGTHNFRNPVGADGDIRIGVKTYITRSREVNSFNNDLVILTLVHPVNFTDNISPVCIALTDPPVGTVCYATGWGYTETGWTDILKQVALPISTDEMCRNESNGQPLESKLCAGAQMGKDTCQGDSGGPLVCLMDNVWQLVGVTSYGNADCGTNGRPGVYTRITYFRDWIFNNL